MKRLKLGTAAFAIQREVLGNDHLTVSDSYHTLGKIYWKIGNFDEALAHFNEVLSIRKKQLPNVHPIIGATLNDIGLILWEKGHFEEALAHFERALQIQLLHFSEMHPNIADVYTNIGIVFYQLGDIEEALNNSYKALRIRSGNASEQLEKILACYNNIGVLHLEKKEFDQALEFHQKALKLQEDLLGVYHPDVAASYNNIALIHDALGNDVQALQTNLKALEIRRAFLPEHHPEVARSYENIGIAYQKSGQFLKSEQYLRKALKIRKQSLGDQHPEVGYSFRQMGILFEDKKQYRQALDWYFKALAVQVNALPEGHPEIAATHIRIGKIYELESDFGLALDYYQKAIICLDQMRRSYSGAATRQLHLEENYAVFEHAIRSLHKAHLSNPTRFDLKQAFIYAEKAKANLLRDALNLLRAESFSGIPDSLLHQERDLRQEIAYFEKKEAEMLPSSVSIDSNQLREVGEQIFALRQKHSLLISRFEQNYLDYYRLKYDAEVISVGEVQEQLADDQALLEYFIGEQAIYVFIIEKEDFRLEVLEKDFPLEKWINDFRSSIFDYFYSRRPSESLYNRSITLFVQHAFNLFQQLIRPLGQLPEQLIIIPDHVLGYIPFEILLTEPTEKQDHFAFYPYLLRRHQISYNFSATLWQEMQSIKTSTAGALILAPAFAKPAKQLASTAPLRKLLDPLLFNREEGEAIRKLSNGRLLQGKEATTRIFHSLAPGAGILHLATHAKLDDRKIDFSYLALAGSNDSIPYEKVFIRDLYDMRLSANMVVLSACETGIGKLQSGEGIISLARGFAYAGAKSIVTSLWSVNDRSTAKLMKLFYQNLKVGMTKDEALQQAKLSYLEEQQDPLFAHPFYWAAFVGVGDMVEVTNFHHRGWWVGVLILGLGISLVIVGLLFWRP